MERIQKLKAKDIRLKNIPKAATEAAFVCAEAKKILKRLFSPEMVKGITVVSYQSGVLKISVKGNAYAQELKMNQESFLQHIKEVAHITQPLVLRFTHTKED
ncbi:MAG: hypothetical protein WC045_02795 [Patescibacteria group bacterium]